jgi:hypothetical protein
MLKKLAFCNRNNITQQKSLVLVNLTTPGFYKDEESWAIVPRSTQKSMELQ